MILGKKIAKTATMLKVATLAILIYLAVASKARTRVLCVLVKSFAENNLSQRLLLTFRLCESRQFGCERF